MLLEAMLLSLVISAPPVFVDVALENNELRGRAAPNTAVVCQQGGHVVRQTTSGDDGLFTLTLRPGIYLIETPHASILCRVWADGTAPPAARKLVLPVVRGQNPGFRILQRLDPWTWPVIMVSGIGLATWAALDSAS